MKALVIILSIVIFSACLYIGIMAGSSSNPLPFLSESTPNPAAPAANQRTIVITGVDDLTSDTPRLVSVWVVFFRPDAPRLAALPLYPQNRIAGNTSQKLATAFSLTAEKQPSADFTAALKEFKFAWNGMIVIDKPATAALIDWLGGVTQSGIQLDGSSASGILVDPWADPSAALESQTNLGESLCQRVGQAGGLDWNIFISKVSPDHLYTDLDLKVLSGELAGLLTLEKPFSCEFVTSVE